MAQRVPSDAFRYLHSRRRSALLLGLGFAALFPAGCGVLNPAFVAIIDPEGVAGDVNFPNPSGHVTIQFVNNAEIEERLIAYLETAEGGSLGLTDAEKRALRPRFRFNLLVTFADETQTVLPIEFESASDAFVELGCLPSEAQFPVDDNFVLICEVARVEFDPSAPLQVLVPVAISTWELQEFTTVQGGVTREFVPRDEIPCGWRTLQLDDPRSVENPILRNIDPRALPGPVFPQCGDVITYEITGTLSVPFLTEAEPGPSYDIDAEQIQARIGGRFEIRGDLRR